MKRHFLSMMMLLCPLAGCQQYLEDDSSDASLVVLPSGPVVLEDTGFGIYYGNTGNDGTGLFCLVLSDARCFRDGIDKPYPDSEGDMLVLNIETALLDDGAEIAVPAGEYDASASYVTRLSGNVQSKWDVVSGTVSVSREDNGDYRMSTRDMVLSKGGLVDSVDYVLNSPIAISDYLTLAPSMVSAEDDITDVPFTDVEGIYYGNLFGNGTGNFVVNMSTKGFVTDGQMQDVPGIYITMNFFSKLYPGNAVPVLEEGKYTVSGTSSSTLLSRWTLMPGLLMDSTPFGTYLLQIASDGENVMEYITSGAVDVSYDGDICTLIYDFRTSARKISGTWKGEITFDNQADTGSTDSYLSTLDHDVECNMDKITSGTLVHIETLHRNNVEAEWDYDIAEAWQLYLQPRDWTEEEYDIPWNQDDNGNGVQDRLEAWCADGDVMVLEFILPLGSQGVIAPELGKTYTYTMQPDLAATDEMYEIYVSRMGRPHDEIFDPYYAEQYPGWATALGITDYDRCNARRGFSWSTDGFRGNWYLHYETGRHGILDGHAPAVNGYVKVTRTAEDIYDFEWDFIDDYPGTPNRITGSINGCTVKIR